MQKAEISKDPSMLGYIKVGICLLMFTPLVHGKVFYFPYSSTKTFFFLAVIEVIFLCYAWLIFFHPQYRPRFSLMGKSLFLFVGILLLASIFGNDPVYSFWGGAMRSLSIIVWIHLAGLYIVLVSVFRTIKDWQNLLLVSVCVGVVVSLIYLLSLAGFDLFVKPKSGSTLGNSSFLGAYLLFQISFAFLLAFIKTNSWKRTFGICSFIFLVFTLLQTHANAAIFSLYGAVVLFLALFLITRKKSMFQKNAGKLLLVGLGVAFFSFLVLTFVPESFVREFIIDKSSGTRFVLWDIAWKGIKERPLLGWGLENYQNLFAKFYNPCLGSQACGFEIWFDRAHNKILDVLVETGVIGLIAYMSIFVSALLTIWRSYKKQMINGIVVSLILAILAAYFVMNLTVFDTLLSYVFWLVLLAFIEVTTRSNIDQELNHTKRKVIIPALVPVIATLVMPVTFFFFVIQPVRANIATRNVVISMTMNERFSDYEKALGISMMGIDKRRSFLAAQTTALIWDTDLKILQDNKELFQKELWLAQNGLIQTIERRPNYLRAYLDLGFLYQTEARFYNPVMYKDAEEITIRALELNPNSPLPYWALVSIYIDQDQIKKALPFVEKAVALDSQVPDSHLRRLVAMKFTEDKNLIQQAIDESLQTHPTLEEKIQTLISADLDQYRDILLFRFYYDARL